MELDKRRMMVRTMVGLGILAAVIGGWLFIRTPQFTMTQIVEAYEDNDLEYFKKYVDVPAVSSSLVDQYVEALISLRAERVSDPRSLNMMKTKLITAVEKQITEFITSGRYQPNPTTQAVFPDIKTLRNRFQGVDYIRAEGRLAYIGLITSDGMGNIVIKMKRKGLGWQVFAVKMTDYFKRTIPKWTSHFLKKGKSF